MAAGSRERPQPARLAEVAESSLVIEGNAGHIIDGAIALVKADIRTDFQDT